MQPMAKWSQQQQLHRMGFCCCTCVHEMTSLVVLFVYVTHYIILKCTIRYSLEKYTAQIVLKAAQELYKP